MSKHEDDYWNDPAIKKAERLLYAEHFSKDELEAARWDREVMTPLAADLQAEADEANEMSADLLAELDVQWNGMLSRNGIVQPRGVNQTRKNVVELPDGRRVWLNPSTRCLEEVL